jgi:hypothetical protein
MPMRHLTVTATCDGTTAIIARTQSATTNGSAIRQAPNRPLWTRSLGQPTFRLISSKPAAAPSRAASPSIVGSAPPSCSATGCSDAWNASSRDASPYTSACAVIISVYSRTVGCSSRNRYRQWVSVYAIIGATAMRWCGDWYGFRSTQSPRRAIE